MNSLLIVLIIFISLNILLIKFKKELYSNYFKDHDATIFIITMINNDERRDKILKNIVYNDNNPFPTFIFPAIVGKNLKEQDKNYFLKNNYVNKTFFKDWNAGQQGCALSHLLLMDYILKSGNDNQYYIIMEDDTYFDNSFILIMNELIKNYENNNVDKNCKQIILHNDKDLNVYPNKFQEIKGNKINFLKKCKQCVGTGGYLIKRQDIKYIFDKILPISLPIDEILRFKNDKQCCIDPHIIRLNNVKSTIMR